jgi:hypothetical protein
VESQGDFRHNSAVGADHMECMATQDKASGDQLASRGLFGFDYSIRTAARTSSRNWLLRSLQESALSTNRPCSIRSCCACPKRTGHFGTYSRFGEIREFLDSFENLFLLGRNGMHRYNNQDHSMLTAMTAVDNIIAGRQDKANIWELNTEMEYHEERSVQEKSKLATATAAGSMAGN